MGVIEDRQAETAEQVHDLESLACHFGQGYFFGKPLPADELPAIGAADTDEHAWAAALQA